MVHKLSTHTGWGKHAAGTDASADYNQALRAAQSLPWADAGWRARSADTMRRAVVRTTTTQPLLGRLTTAIDELHALELATYEPPQLPNSPADALLASRRLRALADNRAACEARWPAWRTAVIQILRRTVAALPEPAQGIPITTVPAIELFEDPVALVTDIVATALTFHDDHGIQPGSGLAAQIRTNLLAVSKIPAETAARNPHRLVQPAHSGLTGTELIDAYLGRTPFTDLLLMPVPFSIPVNLFLEHGICLAPSGWGKSWLYLSMINSFLKLEDPPAIIAIDNTGETLQHLQSLDHFNPRNGRLRDRLVIIDPADQPPLNFFDIGIDLAKYPPEHQRSMRNASNELLLYLTRSLDREFTGQQASTVSYLLRLLREIERPTIGTLIDLMSENATEAAHSKYAAEIARLDERARTYFETHFFHQRMKNTRMSIGNRLYSLLENETLDGMFSAPTTCFNAFEAMQQKKIVLIKTSSFLLGREGAQLFGRFFLAQCLSAAFQRITIPKHQLNPAVIFVDEAGYYYDDHMRFFNEETRKFAVGLFTFSHELSQATEGIRDALASTAIKFAGPVANNRPFVASLLNTTPENLSSSSLRKVDFSYGEFMMHVRTKNPGPAIKVPVRYGDITREPKMSDADLQTVLARNRAALLRPAPIRAQAPQRQPVAAQPVTRPPPRSIPAPAAAQPRQAGRPPRDFGQLEHVTLEDMGLTTPALCDTGAQVSAIVVATMTRRRNNRVAFTITINGTAYALEREILGTVYVTGFHGNEIECPIVSLAITLDGYSTRAQFAVSLDPDSTAQRVILGDTFFAATPFQARFNHGETFLADQRKSRPNRPWTSDEYETDP